MKTSKAELKRRLARLNKRHDELLEKHCGNEEKYTYWGGYEMGYVRGKISEIDKMLDDNYELI